MSIHRQTMPFIFCLNTMYDEVVLANAICAFRTYAVTTGHAGSPVANY